jgi:hypothetical protein
VTHQPWSGRHEVNFLIDHKDDLREIRMHRTISGMFIHWQLTDAREAPSSTPASAWSPSAPATG